TAFMSPPRLLCSVRLTFGGSGAFAAGFREEPEQAGRTSERARTIVMPLFFMFTEGPLSDPERFKRALRSFLESTAPTRTSVECRSQSVNEFHILVVERRRRRE